jgi:hypothetical protein
MSYCTFIHLLYICVFIVCLCIHSMFMYPFGYPDWGFACFFLSCKANARVTPAKMGQGQHSSWNLCSIYCFFVSFCVLFVCKCVLNYCHRVATQLQLIKYIISYQDRPKHVQCYAKINTFEKLVHLVGFAIGIIPYLSNPSLACVF